MPPQYNYNNRLNNIIDDQYEEINYTDYVYPHHSHNGSDEGYEMVNHDEDISYPIMEMASLSFNSPNSLEIEQIDEEMGSLNIGESIQSPRVTTPKAITSRSITIIDKPIPRDSITKKYYPVKAIEGDRTKNGKTEYLVVYNDDSFAWVSDEHITEYAIDDYYRVKYGGIVYIVCRVSTKNQATDRHVSLEVQESLGLEYARAYYPNMYHKTVRVVSSGFKKVPYEIQETVESAEQGDIILVYRVDRFSRNMKLVAPYLEQLSIKMVDVYSLSENLSLMEMEEDFMGKILDGQKESKHISKRVMASIDYRKKNGLYKSGRSKNKIKNKLKNKEEYNASKRDKTIIMRIKKDLRNIIDLRDKQIIYEELAREFNDMGIPVLNHNPIFRNVAKKEWTAEMIKKVHESN